jgi:hypothetical protein
MAEEVTSVTASDDGAKHSQSQPTLKTRLERVKRSGSAFFAKLRGRLRPATK